MKFGLRPLGEKNKRGELTLQRLNVSKWAASELIALPGVVGFC